MPPLLELAISPTCALFCLVRPLVSVHALSQTLWNVQHSAAQIPPCKIIKKMSAQPEEKKNAIASTTCSYQSFLHQL